MEYGSELANRKNVIYDFDGTIALLKLDWDGWHPQMIHLLSKYEPSYDFPAKLNYSILNGFLGRYQEPLRSDVIEFNRRFETDSYAGYDVNGGLVDYLLQSQDQKAYIYSSNHGDTIIKVLTELGLQNRFVRIVAANDVLFFKPNPDGINRLIFAGQADPESYIMVGDSDADKGVAEAVGIDFLRVTMGS